MKMNSIMMKCNVGRSVLQRVIIVVLVVICGSSTSVWCGNVPIGSAINIGHLTFSNLAMAELSNSPNQDAWWQLADEAWHNSAINRFLSIGPLNASEMQALAAVRGNRKMDGININNTLSDDQHIQRIKKVATTEYKMSTSVAGTGLINVSMWTLMFQCMDEDSGCKDGYLAPIVVVPTADQNQSNFSYATVWLPVAEKVLINAIPASVGLYPPRPVGPFPIDSKDKLGISAAFNTHDHLAQCPSQAPSAYVYRTLLDSAYGLAPAISCVRFSEDHSLKILVLTGNQSDTSNSSPFGSSWPYKAVPNEVASLPLQECSQAPLMMVDAPTWSDDLTMCHYNRCITLSFNSTWIHHTGLEALKKILAVLKSSSHCTPTDIGEIDTANCSAFAKEESILGSVPYYTIGLLSSAMSFSGASTWVSEHGAETRDFQYATNLGKVKACYTLLKFPSLYTGNSSNVAVPREIKIQATAYLTSYIAEHNAAFTTDQGPATNPYTFYALIVSTALSVITIAVPFTNIMLHKICRMRPTYLKRTKKAMKIIIQVCCNVVLSFAFLLPVISLAKNELAREKAFSTWYVASDDLVYDQISSSSPQIRVLYVFSATSMYNSHFLTIILLVVCFTCIPVAISTARRCLQVFARYDLLCKDDDSQKPCTSYPPYCHAIKAMKAIEMGEADYLEYLKGRVPSNKNLGNNGFLQCIKEICL